MPFHIHHFHEIIIHYIRRKKNQVKYLNICKIVDAKVRVIFCQIKSILIMFVEHLLDVL